MSAAAQVAIILFVFFLTGIIVGIIAVIAIPARRPTRRLAARTGQDRPRLRGHITAGPVQATMSRPVSVARACRSASAACAHAVVASVLTQFRPGFGIGPLAPGIAEAERPRLFDRFHRATELGSGAGPGLAIGDSIVRSTGGRWHIW